MKKLILSFGLILTSFQARAELPVDKAAHMGLSLAIQTTCEAAIQSHTRRWVRHVGCGVFTASVGIAKEVWDSRGNGNPELADLAADGSGLTLGILVMHW